MGIKNIPSVNIYVQDKSDLPNLTSVGAIVGTLIVGERGFEDVIEVDRKTFFKYFTDINKSDKVSYVGCVEILENANKLLLGACSKNAKYGGVYITDRGLKSFVGGYSSLKNFDIYYKNVVELSNFVGNVSSGQIDLSKGVVKTGSLVIEYILNSEMKRVYVNENWEVIGDTNISNFSFDNDTGNYSISFVIKPDDEKIKFEYNAYSNIYVGKVNKGVGNGSNTTFNFDINDKSIKVDSLKIYYKIGDVDYIGETNESGVITGTKITSGNVVYSNNKYSVSIVFEEALDDGSNLDISYISLYKYLGCIIAKGSKSWSNKYGYKVVSVDSEFKNFVINEYERQDDNSDLVVNSYEVSLNKLGENKFGRNIFIESVFDNSYYGVAYINEEYENMDILPVLDSNVVYMAGGNDGDSVTDTEKVQMLSKFEGDNIYFNYFCGNGNVSKSVIDKISSLVNYKNKVAYMDCLDSDNVDTIVSWAEENMPDNYRCFWYSPFVYTTYNGAIYYCGVSAKVVSKQCELAKNNKEFMSVSGVGNGSLNVVRLLNVYSKDDQAKLSAVGINAVRNLKGYGVVVMDNQTGQKKFSGTSFINSVLTLCDMIENLENILPQLQLNRVINEETFITLRQLVTVYLTRLENKEGTIEPSWSKYGWVLKIDELNNEITRDLKEINCELIFSFQSVLRSVNMYLTYMNNQMIVKFK